MFNDKKKFLFPLLVVVLTLGTAALLHSNLKDIKKSPTMARAPWALSTGNVTIEQVTKGFPALAKVVTSSEVRIVPQIGGTVLKMGPRAGGKVRKGDLLIRIDTRTLQAQASALEAKLTGAIASKKYDQNELQREQHLLKEGGSSASAVEQRETKLQSDIANVRSLKKQLEAIQVEVSYGNIKAPINGQISRRLAEPGDTIVPGKIVYALTASQGGRVIVPVPLNTLTKIAVAGQVELSIDKQKMMTSITRINPSLDSLSMGRLEIDLPQRPFNLPDGAPIAARVMTASRSGITVPVQALLPSANSGHRKLFKVLPGKTSHLKLISVTVELCNEFRCVVEGTLKLDDAVITAHQSILLQLHDGDPVNTSEKAE